MVCIRLYWTLSRNTGSGRLYGEHSDILIRESSFKERGYGDKRRFGKNIYIKSMKLNGKPYDSTWIDWDQLSNGATIEYTTSSKPDVKWGTKVTPPSFP